MSSFYTQLFLIFALVINMWCFFFHVGVAIFSFVLFFCLDIFVAQNVEVKFDKGKLPVKVEQVAISLDDLVAEKTGARSFGISNKTGCDDLEGNKTGSIFYVFLFLIHIMFSVSLAFPEGIIYSTPAIPVAAPIKNSASSTPRTRLRMVRVKQPSKHLLHPFKCITSSKHQDSIYQKVIIHTKEEKRSRINKYNFCPLCIPSIFSFPVCSG